MTQVQGLGMAPGLGFRDGTGLGNRVQGFSLSDGTGPSPPHSLVLFLFPFLLFSLDLFFFFFSQNSTGPSSLYSRFFLPLFLCSSFLRVSTGQSLTHNLNFSFDCLSSFLRNNTGTSLPNNVNFSLPLLFFFLLSFSFFPERQHRSITLLQPYFCFLCSFSFPFFWRRSHSYSMILQRIIQI